MTTRKGDKYGDTDFDRVPRGPFAGKRWAEVPALTLHNILNAVDFGLVELDERRVVAIREGLREKDCGTTDHGTTDCGPGKCDGRNGPNGDEA